MTALAPAPPAGPRCAERPAFHLAPPHGGWVNDPNAPVVDSEGRVHLVREREGAGLAMGAGRGTPFGHAVGRAGAWVVAPRAARCARSGAGPAVWAGHWRRAASARRAPRATSRRPDVARRALLPPRRAAAPRLCSPGEPRSRLGGWRRREEGVGARHSADNHRPRRAFAPRARAPRWPCRRALAGRVLPPARRWTGGGRQSPAKRAAKGPLDRRPLSPSPQFYQHLIEGCTWDFGIVWGHAVSDDMVTWRHLPPALAPSPGGPDADGCFSGCAAVDAAGVVHLLYTGVRLRSNADAGPPPAPEHDLQLPFIEAQLCAVPDPSDPTLSTWTKLPTPILALPPANAPLVGWRDPFIFETAGRGGAAEWGMLLGSGFKGRGGTALIYRAATLTSEWRYEGTLCEADTADTGAMWECPLIARLVKREEEGAAATTAPPPAGPLASNIAPFAPGSAAAAAGAADAAAAAVAGLSLEAAAADYGEAPAPSPPHDHFFCVSPDAPTNPVLYWMGGFDAAATRFDLATASGPHRLDLGDVLYAPNLMTDAQGRHVLWGWLQERRGVGSYDYAGCMAVPRLLTRTPAGRLHQEPLPEVSNLRTSVSWAAQGVRIAPEVATPVERVASPRLDLTLVLDRGDAVAAGVLVRSWAAGGEGSAAIVVDWEAGVLEAVFEGGGDGGAGQRRVGGPVALGPPGAPVTLRLLLDHSACEVYLGSGEVLSTRVYRGSPPPGADAGVDLVSYGGSATALHVEAHEMGTMAPAAAPAPAAVALPVALPRAAYEPIAAGAPVAERVS